MLRRPWLLAGALAVAALVCAPDSPWSGPSVAEARVSLAHTLPSLVDAAPWSVIGVPGESRSAWEALPGGRRIVTYTKVEIVETVYGSRQELTKKGKTVWVRRLGGAVGKIGQQVAGEATLVSGKPALLFLAKSRDGVLSVAGAAQGHFPLAVPASADPDAPAPILERALSLNRAMGKLVRRPGPVVTVQEALAGKKVATALAMIRQSKAAQDAAKKR
jgi:hypothetical protein